MSTCQTCRYWSKRSPIDSHGLCGKITDLTAAEDAMGPGDRLLFAFIDTRPFPHDPDEGIGLEMRTDGHFGCLLWMPPAPDSQGAQT